MSSSASPFPCTPHPFRSTKIDNPIRRNQKSSSNPGRRRRDYELLLLLVCVGSHKREIAQCIHVSFICRANRLNLIQSFKMEWFVFLSQRFHVLFQHGGWWWWCWVLETSVLWICALHVADILLNDDKYSELRIQELSIKSFSCRRQRRIDGRAEGRKPREKVGRYKYFNPN